MNFAKHKIVVNVPTELQHGPELSVEVWSAKDISPTFSAKNTLIDTVLGAPGTCEVLERAFQRGLSRSTAWQSEGLTAEQLRALRSAARIYKRGVRVLGSESRHQGGTSAIFFVKELDQIFSKLRTDDHVFVDQNVMKLWWHQLPRNLCVVEVDESNKSLESVAKLAALIAKSAKRVVVIGGGVLGDVAGFVAALRSLPTVYVPTTLLSMADSSVGGKTGVNYGNWGKNQVGLFHPPAQVFVWPGWLETLSDRDLKSGAAECLKHALLAGDQSMWNALISIFKNGQWSEMSRYLMRIVSIKAEVVSRDPFERGERAILNFGHTLGHALEALSLDVDGRDALSHGSCVALGMVYALRLSMRTCGFSDAENYIKKIYDAGLVPNFSERMKSELNRVERYLKGDKKNQDQRIQWVLMTGFGKIARGQDGSWTTFVDNSLDEKQLCLL